MCTLATNRDRIQATRDAQETVDIVSKWSHSWKLSLNATKSEVSFFTNNTHDANWKPTITIDKKEIAFQKFPRLLGVVLDRQMTLSQHVTNVTTSASTASRMLLALSHSEYGWRKEHLVSVYNTFIMSKMDYSGPAWQPNLAVTQVAKLERVQNRALRLITGQFADCPLDALRLEAGVVSYETHIKRNVLRSREKALRSHPSHPRRLAYEESVPQRLKRHSWRSLGDELACNYFIDNDSERKPMKFHQVAPWDTVPLKNVFPLVPGLKGTSEPKLRRMILSYRRLRELPADFVIYTDGSAAAGVRDGGAAAIVTTGPPEGPVPVEDGTVMARGASLTCSYAEEASAMHLAADWIETNCHGSEKMLIVTDSQSLCGALLGHGEDVAELRLRLLSVPADLAIQWVPGHSNIAGNDMVDTAAKAATTLNEPQTSIAYSGICAVIRSEVRDVLTHERSMKVYSNISKKKEKEITSRSDQVLLARVRSGHHWFFESYHHLVNSDHNTTCPISGCGDPVHDLEHWLCKCPANTLRRQKIFGDTTVELGILSKSPALAVMFAREAMKIKTRDVPHGGRDHNHHHHHHTQCLFVCNPLLFLYCFVCKRP